MSAIRPHRSVFEARGEVVSGALTLIRIELKSEEAIREDSTEGTISALDSGSITIQTGEGDGSSGVPIIFTVPDGFTLPTA